MRAFDAVSVLESAYLLDGDDDAWLAGVSQSITPLLDQGDGVASYIGRVDGRFSIDRFAGTLGAQGVQGAETDLARTSTFVEGVFCGAPGYFRMTDLIGAEFAEFAQQTTLLRERGAVDVVFMRAMNLDGAGCMFGAPARRKVRPVGATRGHKCRLMAMHVASAFRLREALRGRSSEGEAVLSPDGRVLDAAGTARSVAGREALRAAVVAMDRARGRLRRSNNDGAIDLWQSLVAARWTLVDRFESDGRRFVVAHRNPPPVNEAFGLTERERQVAAHAAAGLSNKAIAYALGLPSGSVATGLETACTKLGLPDRVALITVGAALGVAWCPKNGIKSPATATTVSFGHPATELAYASAKSAAPELPPALQEVVRLLCAGRSQAEIAAARNVSPRTVANQVAAIYQRLGLSGRSELVAYMAGRPR